MQTSVRHPKVAEGAKQVEAADEKAGREPCVMPEPVCSDDQGESAEQPSDRAEVQEQRNESSDRSPYPRVGLKELLKRSNREPLDQDAVNHRYAASDVSGHCQGSVAPVHDHTPLYGIWLTAWPE